VTTWLVAGVVLFTSGCLVKDSRHEDGSGSLESSPGNQERLVSGKDLPNAVWSYGIWVCTTDPDHPPRLADAAVTGQTSGTFLGARFLTNARWPDGNGFMNGKGFPPVGFDPERLRPVSGATVDARCGVGTWPYQVMFGLRLDGGGQGGWTGEEITYMQGDAARILVLHNVFIFCGPKVNPPECGQLDPQVVENPLPWATLAGGR